MEEELNCGPSLEQAKNEDVELDVRDVKLPPEKSFLTSAEDDERDEKAQSAV